MTRRTEEAIDEHVQVNSHSNWAHLSPAATPARIDNGKAKHKRLVHSCKQVRATIDNNAQSIAISEGDDRMSHMMAKALNFVEKIKCIA